MDKRSRWWVARTTHPSAMPWRCARRGSCWSDRPSSGSRHLPDDRYAGQQLRRHDRLSASAARWRTWAAASTWHGGVAIVSSAVYDQALRRLHHLGLIADACDALPGPRSGSCIPAMARVTKLSEDVLTALSASTRYSRRGAELPAHGRSARAVAGRPAGRPARRVGMPRPTTAEHRRARARRRLRRRVVEQVWPPDRSRTTRDETPAANTSWSGSTSSAGTGRWRRRRPPRCPASRRP
jgi:hypothetical protein